MNFKEFWKRYWLPLIILLIIILVFGVILYSREKCVDSDKQCEGKLDGAQCNYGVWCDEFGRVCGGQSCSGMGFGECSSGVCTMTESLNKTKTAVASFEFRNNILSLKEFKIIHNSAPDYISENEGLNFTLIGNNKIIRSFLIWDPRIILTEDEAEYRDNVNFTISIPLTLKENELKIYNSTNSLLLSVNITPYISNFCSFEDGICDEDCPEIDVDCS